MAGNITIIPPKENFLKVPKGVIYDEEVDALSLGIYVKVMALGRKWNLNVPGLAKILGISEDRVRHSFAVLEKAGFLRRRRSHGDRGRFSGWDYEVASEPFTDMAKIPTSVKTDIGENRHRENDTLYRDNIIGDRDCKEKNRDTKAGGRFVRPTVEEVAEYCESRGNNIDPEAFVAFYDSKGWKVGSAPMKDWRAAVITWEKRHKEEAPAANGSKTYSIEEYISKH